MKTSSHIISILLAVSMLSICCSAVAGQNKSCQLSGSYGYLYNGTSFTSSGPVPLTESGFFTVDDAGYFSGEGTLVFNFTDFGGNGPLWLLLKESQFSGEVAQGDNNSCTGKVSFLATGVVIKTSDAALVSVGTVLFADSPRSIAYSISGLKNEVVDMVSTSPGTVASGTAHKQKTSRSSGFPFKWAFPRK